MSRQGKFITIYGINNIGKSTQAKLLVERLTREGCKARYVKYPVYDLKPTGPFLNKILRCKGEQKISEDELQFWFILNRYQFEPQIKKWLMEGYIVIAEDYIGTGIAWGTAKGLSLKWLEEANKYLLKEDLAILIEGERDKRVIEARHVHEQNPGLIKKCAKILNDLAKKYGWRRIKRMGKIEQTSENLWKIVKEAAS